MRELKFRTWSKKHSQWMDHCAVINSSGELGSYFLEKMEDGSFAQHLIGLDRAENIIQVFTGLKDKNGQEIYEGDIIEYSRAFPIDEEDWNYSKRVGIVEWAETQYGKKPGWEIINKDRDYYGGWPGQGCVLVVGNIFENKELLNEV